MKKALLLTVTGFVLMGAAAPAQANSKWWIFGWPPSHFEHGYQPYIQDGKHAHIHQWDDKKWTPADWVNKRGEDSLVNGFYYADILRDEYEKSDVPVLAVGMGFFRLSRYDQYRVVATMEYIDQARHSGDEDRVSGIYRIYDAHNKEYVGEYSSSGLVMQ